MITITRNGFVARPRLATLAAVILVLALAGCGGAKQPATTTTASPASAQTGNSSTTPALIPGARIGVPFDLSINDANNNATFKITVTSEVQHIP